MNPQPPEPQSGDGSTEAVDTSIPYENRRERLCRLLSHLDAQDSDLAEVVKAWETLPEAVKAGILAMVRTQRENRQV